jgi:3-oxoacyl-[acyl-carrier protein] reductase
MEITGAKVMVTGAAAGIGRACALMLARQGASQLVLVDKQANALRETASAVEAAGASATCRVVDLRRADDVARLVRDAETETGGLDILHNNAGMMSGPPDFPDTHLDRMVAAIEVNLVAPIVATRVMIEEMRRRGRGGLILNTASTAAFGPLPPDPVYSSTKAALVNFTQACKPLWDQFGIRVMAVCPGITDTDIVQREAEWLKPALQMLKIYRPEDVAEAVREIIADDSASGEFVALHNEVIAT